MSRDREANLPSSSLLRELTSSATERLTRRDPRLLLSKVLRQDYVKNLQNGLTYKEILTLVKHFSAIFPGFNARSVRLMSLMKCNELGARLGFNFKSEPYNHAEGRALRGFYVRNRGPLKRPLLFVNSAHPPGVVGTSFIHELAHHVTATSFPLINKRGRQLFDADFLRQLEEPGELAADVMVSLAGYPKNLARKIFTERSDVGFVADVKSLPKPAFAKVRRHLSSMYNFKLSLSPSSQMESLEYSVGAIHYAKLRWAILTEYDL